MNTFQVKHYLIELIIDQNQLLIDFGLVVLIWMVQLIVYPSFIYHTKENLFAWHKKYTKRIAVIVIPLMLLQLALAVTDVFLNINFTTVFTLSIVLALWIFTFLGFAPLHFKISENNSDNRILLLLVQRNWIRTFLWTGLFVFHLLIYLL